MTGQQIIQLVTGLGTVLAALGALYHSWQTRKTVTAAQQPPAASSGGSPPPRQP